MTRRFAAAHRGRVLQAAALADGQWYPGGQPDAEDLAGLLYAAWYAPTEPHRARPVDEPALAAVFRAVHAAARDPWLPARVVRTGIAGVVVVRTDAGELRAVTRGEYLHPVAGTDAVLVSAVHGAVASGGWWRTWGGGWDPARPPVPVSRLYLSVAGGRAPQLVAAVTAALAGAAVPWLFKLGVDESTLARPDAGVAYVPDDCVPAVLAALDRATQGLRGTAVPALACEAAPGLAWAQSPADDRSFGETVCGLLAAVLVEHPADVLAAAERAFLDAGLDPARPHLRAAVREPVPS